MDRRADPGAPVIDCSEVVARHDLDQIRRDKLTFGSGIVGRIGPIIDRHLDVGIGLEHPVVGFVHTLVNSMPGDSITRSKPLLNGSAPCRCRSRCEI